MTMATVLESVYPRKHHSFRRSGQNSMKIKYSITLKCVRWVREVEVMMLLQAH